MVVLRTALKPRWLGLLVVVLLVIVAFIQLGRWQLGVAHDKAAKEQIAQVTALPPVDVTMLLKPHEEFPAGASSRRVFATGRYAADGQVLVPDRLLRGQTGYWVMTPFVVEATGARLAVLRGFVTSPTGIATPPRGRLTIHGGLAPGESPSTKALPPGQLGSVDLSILVNTWPGDLYNAFMFLGEESAPADGTDAAPAASLNALTHVPTPAADTGLKWRNLAYALQWWVFAGFAAYMWWRMVRDDQEAEADGSDGDGSDGDGSDGEGVDGDGRGGEWQNGSAGIPGPLPSAGLRPRTTAGTAPGGGMVDEGRE